MHQKSGNRPLGGRRFFPAGLAIERNFLYHRSVKRAGSGPGGGRDDATSICGPGRRRPGAAGRGHGLQSAHGGDAGGRAAGAVGAGPPGGAADAPARLRGRGEPNPDGPHLLRQPSGPGPLWSGRGAGAPQHGPGPPDPGGRRGQGPGGRRSLHPGPAHGASGAYFLRGGI